MLYREILVVLDDAPGCEERVNVALRLAAPHGARVTALMVERVYRLPRLATTGLPSTNGNEPRRDPDEGLRAGAGAVRAPGRQPRRSSARGVPAPAIR